LARELPVDAVFTGESADVPGLLSAMDVLVAPSEEETFGLAVLEGLAAGLPVFYGACPALDDVPVASVPAAHRLPTDPEAMRRVLGAVVHEPPERLAPPAVLDRFDLARIAGRTNAVYRRVAGVRSHKQPAPVNEKG
jgi:glycosyltransferase involved in cell wall biosynthesis